MIETSWNGILFIFTVGIIVASASTVLAWWWWEFRQERKQAKEEMLEIKTRRSNREAYGRF